VFAICVGGFRGGLHVGGRVHRSGRDEEEVILRVDFGVGSRDGEGESESDDFVGVRGRLNDIRSTRRVSVANSRDSSLSLRSHQSHFLLSS
jgi:hypothetical protein